MGVVRVSWYEEEEEKRFLLYLLFLPLCSENQGSNASLIGFHSLHLYLIIYYLLSIIHYLFILCINQWYTYTTHQVYGKHVYPLSRLHHSFFSAFKATLDTEKFYTMPFFLLERNKVQEKRGLNKVSIKRQTGKAWQDNRHRYRHRHKHKHKPYLCTQG